MSKTIILGILVVTIVGIGGYMLMNSASTGKSAVSSAGNMNKDTEQQLGTGYKAVVYKEPNCGCCGGYAEALRERGFDVEEVITDDMASVKEEYKVPIGGESCHTMALAGYTVEGHVPMEALEKLLSERPDIDGIGLGGMPMGTPGMPGLKTQKYEVYQTKNGEMVEYITI